MARKVFTREEVISMTAEIAKRYLDPDNLPSPEQMEEDQEMIKHLLKCSQDRIRQSLENIKELEND